MPDCPHLLQTFATAVAPRRPLTVSEWADAHRILVSKGSGEPGAFRTHRIPYMREVMDCFSAGSRVQKVVLWTASQMAKTDGVMINVIGYCMDYLAKPMMVFMPSLESRNKWRIQKLNPLLQHTPVIRDLLGGQKSRDASNTQDTIDFPGATLYLSGANSPQSYAQVSAWLAMLDDLDRFPREVGEEGDPVALARGRLRTFMGGKLLLASTIAGSADTSLIHREYSDSDQRRYHIPCPHCGEMQPLEWGGRDVPHGIKWNTDATDAWYVCRACFGEIQEHHKPTFLAQGRWVAGNPGHPTRGYHLSALYSSIGLGRTWLELVHDWLAAQKSVALLKTFTNTELAEPFDESGDQSDPVGLLARLEEYPEKLPAFLRTLGTDVQKNRLEVTVIDWGDGEEAWIRDHIILAGDTSLPEVWEQLEELEREWSGELPLAHGIDGGFNASFVKAFAEKRAWRHIFIGRDGGARPIVEDPKKRAQRLRRQRKTGKAAEILGDDQAKTLIYARLKLTQPGAGYIHFPNDPAFDDEYFAQLTAEKLITKTRGVRPVKVWVQSRPRNEALDCLKLGLAALRIANIDPGKPLPTTPAAPRPVRVGSVFRR